MNTRPARSERNEMNAGPLSLPPALTSFTHSVHSLHSLPSGLTTFTASGVEEWNRRWSDERRAVR